MSQGIPETNTPVQTPSSDNTFFHKSDDYSGLGDHHNKHKVAEPEKPLSPPNPSPSPEKHKLDDDYENEPKRIKVGSPSPLTQTEQSQPEPEPQSQEPQPQQTPVAAQVFSEPAPKPAPEPDVNNLPQNPIPPHQNKFALNTIKAIKRLRDAGPFIHPVDILKLNIPFYYNHIPRPMDLTTIERKITLNAYEDSNQIVEDFNLMVANCKKFNGEAAGISKMADNIQAHFEKHMLNFPPKVLPSIATTKKVKAAGGSPSTSSKSIPVTSKRKAAVDQELSKRDSVAAQRPKRTIHPPKSKELPYDVRPRKKKFATELRFCSQTVKELMSKKHLNYNFPFLAPVDTVALNIPNYGEVVKVPMDLGTISTKLANNQYENGDQFADDVRLVFKNCYAFNPEGTEVNMMGHRLEAIFEKKWTNRPVPEPTPPNSDSEFSDGEYDDEDNEPEINEEMLSEVPAIQFLENQLIRMKKELDELKKEHLKRLREQQAARKKKKRAKKTAKRKNSTSHQGSVSHSLPVVTYEMKKQVSETVPNLSDKKLQSLIKIIKDDVEISNEDEVELDMDMLEDRTVLKLHNFLFGKKAAAKLVSKKKKPILGSPDDELAHLRNQLALFDDENHSHANSMFMNIGNEESSEDDVSSESSEEE